MKPTIFSLLFTLLFLSSFSQGIKIQDLPSIMYSNNAGYLPISFNNTTYKVPASYVGSVALTTVDSLKYYATLNGSKAVVTDPVRGGTFVARQSSGYTVDSGIVFLSATPGIVWVRDIGQAQSINLKWYGALGLGAASVKQDSTSLVNACAYIQSKGGGKLYIPKGVFAYRGIGVILPSNTEVFGTGAGSIIENVDPQWSRIDSGNYRGTIFVTGTLGPTNPNGMFKTGIPTFNAYDGKKGDTYIKLRNIGDTASFHNWGKGKPFIIGSNIFNKHGDAGKKRYSRGEMNAYTYISADTLFLENPLSNNYYADTAYVQIKIIDGLTSSTGAWGGIPDFISYNIQIHDLTLMQASRNEITGQPFIKTSQKALINSPIAGGQIYKGAMYNLTYNGYGAFAFNMMNQFQIHDCIIYSTVKFLDFGFLSCNFDIYKNKFYLINSPLPIDTSDDTNGGQSLMYMSEGSGNNTVRDNLFSGTYNNIQNIINIAGAFHNSKIVNNIFDLPNYSQPNMNVISLSDGKHGEGDSCYNYGIYIAGNTFNVDKAGRWIKCTAVSTAPKAIRNVTFDNNKFYGHISQTTLVDGDTTYSCILVQNYGNIKMINTSISEGDSIDFNPNYSSAYINGLDAPTAYLTSDLGSNSINLNVKGSNLFTMINNGHIYSGGAQANTGYGIGALSYISNGVSNTALGSNALKQVDSSNNNTAIGRLAMKASASGDTAHAVLNYNTAVGASALPNILTHSDSNTAVGFNAGYNFKYGTANTFIGANISARSRDTVRGAIAIGADANAYDSTVSFPDYAKALRIGGQSYTLPLQSAPTKVRLSSNFVTTNGSPQNAGLSYSVLAGVKYTIRARLEINCSTANGVKIAVICTGSPVLDNGIVSGGNSAINNTKYAFLPDLAGGSAGTWANVITTHMPVLIDVSFTAGSSGTFNIQACAGTGGDTITVYAGSWMEVTVDQ